MINKKFFTDLGNSVLTSFQEPSGKGSGKRKSLFVIVLLIAFVTVMYTDKHNLTAVVGELSLLVVALAGVSSHYRINQSKNQDKNEPEV